MSSEYEEENGDYSGYGQSSAVYQKRYKPQEQYSGGIDEYAYPN